MAVGQQRPCNRLERRQQQAGGIGQSSVGLSDEAYRAATRSRRSFRFKRERVFIPDNTRPGDFNLDGNVDFNDYLICQNGSGMAGTYAAGDANGDGGLILTTSRFFRIILATIVE
ncbi:MAG: hypothetical protein JWM57_1570 [Phycisphaerales bacterium]|nr:hypothetical protein [Phycisphaerales bacterium]